MGNVFFGVKSRSNLRLAEVRGRTLVTDILSFRTTDLQGKHHPHQPQRQFEVFFQRPTN